MSGYLHVCMYVHVEVVDGNAKLAIGIPEGGNDSSLRKTRKSELVDIKRHLGSVGVKLENLVELNVSRMEALIH